MKKVAVNGRTLAISPARPRDADLLAELGARTFSDTYSSILPAGDLALYLREAFSTEHMLQDIANPEVLLFVGSTTDAVCSYIELEPTPTRKVVRGAHPIELLRLYVLPRWKGIGIGAALMDVGLAAAKDKGHKTCWLKVWEGNTRAIDFYENRGFSLVGSEPYPVGSTSRNVVLMARSLE